jgi:hypothetical protein
MDPIFNNAKQPNNNFKPENEIGRRNEFSKREVGLNHPDTNSFIRLTDEGDIEIFAAPGIGIVISSIGRSISLFADNIRMFTKEDGLKWNSYHFNHSAIDYSEPTLLKIDYQSIHSPQNNAEHYLARLNEISQKESVKPITINGDYGFGNQSSQSSAGQKSPFSLPTNGLTEEQIIFVDSILKEYSQEYALTIIELLKSGHTFSQAQEKANEKHNV